MVLCSSMFVLWSNLIELWNAMIELLSSIIWQDKRGFSIGWWRSIIQLSMSTIPLWISIIMIYHFMILSPLPPHRPMTNWTRTGNLVHYLLRPAWRSQIFLLGTCVPVGIYQAITVMSRDRRPLEYLFNSSFGLTSHKHQYLHNGPFLKGTHWNAEK